MSDTKKPAMTVNHETLAHLRRADQAPQKPANPQPVAQAPAPPPSKPAE